MTDRYKIQRTKRIAQQHARYALRTCRFHFGLAAPTSHRCMSPSKAKDTCLLFGPALFPSEIHSPFALSRAHQRRGLPEWSRVGLSTSQSLTRSGSAVDSPIALRTCRLRFLAENGADMLAVDQRNGGLTPKMVMKAQFRYDPTVLLLFRITGSARSGTRLGTV